MTEELHALIPRTGLTPPYTIVGHSLGGFVAQLYAARYPNEVNGVVLVDPSILGFYTSAVALPEWREANDAQTQRMSSASGAVKAEFDAFNRDLDEMRAAPPMPTVPVVLLTATHHGPPAPKPSALDSVWLAEHRLWAAAHPGTRQVVDTIYGHYLQRDVPALVIDAIKSVALPAR
jgi:pimeloyl-ACP methyl ester carboxylesterase